VKRTLDYVWSPQLRNRRTIDVYLPDSYSAGRERYPVVYMQDGQNLSDPETAFAGTWDLEATLDRLAARGRETIVVGVHHAGVQRLAEYSPFPDPRHGGGLADQYLSFLVDTIKPRVDRLFRTRRDRDATAILGSSMGALVSLYAFFHQPTIFGAAGAMSPALWFGGRQIFDDITSAATPTGRIYLDVGALEGAATLRDTRRLARLLARKGFTRERRVSLGRERAAGLSNPVRHRPELAIVRYVEDARARHTEAAWAERLEGTLDFLLPR
jgi:predicted alpha/beta superfamily hydrolase